MDKIILGMILFRKSTIYEIRSFIKSNMQSICSDSTGSIQAAIKKLLNSNQIKIEEINENNKKKKVYYVTEEGVAAFKKWMNEPMDINKAKNMDFGKLFFLGMTNDSNKVKLIRKIIEDYEIKLEYLNGIKVLTEDEKEKQIDHSTKRVLRDNSLKNNLITIAKKENISQIVEDGIDFQFMALDYDIARTKFEIQWYKKLLKKVENKYGNKISEINKE